MSTLRNNPIKRLALSEAAYLNEKLSTAEAVIEVLRDAVGALTAERNRYFAAKQANAEAYNAERALRQRYEQALKNVCRFAGETYDDEQLDKLMEHIFDIVDPLVGDAAKEMAAPAEEESDL